MEKKHYNTAGRAHLAAYLKEKADQPPQSAEEIYTGLCAACAAAGAGAPGRSSVYRMLSTLSEAGEVKKFRASTGDEGFVYQYVGAKRHCDTHFHLHCLSCGDVMHLECKCSEEIAAHLLASHGFRADRGRSVLYGVCSSCAAKEAAQ